MLYYKDDCFVEPWVKPEVICLIHGGAESGQVWYEWIPLLASQFRVIRPDLPGHGRSTVPPSGYDWSPASLANDLTALLDRLEIPSLHLVGSKFGSSVALEMAAANPDRISTLTVLHPKFTAAADFVTNLRNSTLRGWVLESNRHRLGPDVSKPMLDWYNELMSSCDERVIREVIDVADAMDLNETLSKICSPTLVVGTDHSPIASVHAAADWASLIAHAELLVLPGKGYHVGLLNAIDCARATIDFIGRHRQAARVSQQ
jgi:3-oxoadipate enol-lactonase